MATRARVSKALREADPDSLAAVNDELRARDAGQRIGWLLDVFAERVVLASSFGAQAAVMLHLVSRRAPGIPVVLIDTGYLFPETYRFADHLRERLSLNLHVYCSKVSPAWQEARYGRLWEQGPDGLERYNHINKVEPMQRALNDLGAVAWLSGVRQEQAASRAGLDVLALQNGRVKIHPIVDWTDHDVAGYLDAHDLPRHPLHHQGYVSIGDWHTTRPLQSGMDERDVRFFGLKRECGLHEHA